MLELEARAEVGPLALDVALEIGDGECLALAGPSGAGKTSVLRVAAGLLTPREGAVRCGEATWLDTRHNVALAPEDRRCGYLFQEYALFPTMTALQNVAYSLRETSRAERRTRAQALLDRFGVGHLAHERPRTLSGGEQQRVALARALARRPQALLLDEPLSALDARTRASAARTLGEIIRESGVPALLVTHDFAEAAELGDRVGVIDAGRIVQTGTATELAARPATSFVADFAGAVVLTGIARPADGGLTAVDLDGGGTILSTDPGEGPVAASVFPWEIALELTPPEGSAQNHLAARVTSVTAVGNRARVALARPQPLVAEVTAASAERLALRAGAEVVATWKAAATRIVAR